MATTTPSMGWPGPVAARLPSLLLGLLLWACIAPASAGAQTSDADNPPVVNCYDPKHDQVQVTLEADCTGEAVSDAEAAAVRQRRIERMQKAFKRKSTPLAPGRRLVSIGTGFFVASGGRILTNRHVVADCAQVSVTTTAGERLEAEVTDSSTAFDLALLQVATQNPAHAVFARPNDPLTDLPIVLVGYPNQGIAPIKPLLTPGRTLERYQVSRLGVMVPVQAEVRKGNSGGPVIDESGRVIGVITAKIDTVSTYRQTGRVVRDVGFAISNSVVLGFLERNKVPVETAGPARKDSAEELFDAARPYIVRVGCWR